MLIFNQKRIITIFLMVFVSLFAFSFKIANNNMLNKEITTETVALPVTNRVIVIDAGHGTPDEGAESNNGVTEAEINLRIALKLQNLLEQSGAKVILTRSNETAIYDIDKKTLREKKVSDIHNRVKIGNESSADIFVSIHLNKIPQNQYWGWQCFYNQNEKSKILAENLQNNLNEAIQKENKRIAMKLDTVYIMKNVEIPISIVECGFLSNEEEEKRLQEDDYQNRLAWGIYNGIMDYFN
ncbi:MAG: N-acetylmuramoyl-L-alanine amidase CwlD [Clostridia bacterium]|jgi:N-acetylmuramoyl-L-alanine amidase|nr:N-acetylmuramoyl-L-alanine amidase CwlD [Clostridia bacterium]CDE83852.1 n-acetylmuramoyl-L-alanine amidase CwlD [Clostridium sp. CAG:273]